MTESRDSGGSSQLPLAIFAGGIVAIGVAVLLGILLSSGRGDGSDAEEVIVNDMQVTVEIEDFVYSPSNVSVLQGASVTWRNLDAAVHDARDDDGDWTTPLIQQGGAAALNFNTPGTFTYHCSVHPYMKATLTVRPHATASPTPSPDAG